MPTIFFLLHFSPLPSRRSGPGPISSYLFNLSGASRGHQPGRRIRELHKFTASQLRFFPDVPGPGPYCCRVWRLSAPGEKPACLQRVFTSVPSSAVGFATARVHTFACTTCAFARIRDTMDVDVRLLTLVSRHTADWLSCVPFIQGQKPSCLRAVHTTKREGKL